MSGVVWLINPHKLGTKARKATNGRKATNSNKAEKKAMARPSKKGAAKKPRTAAQKAATAKMLAARKKSAAPKAKPAKRRSYAKAAVPAKAAAKRRYKRNPVAVGKKAGMVNMLIHDFAIPAGIGIGGALAVDAAWGNMKFIPIDIRTGKLRYLAKPALAVGAALLVSKVMPKARRVAMKIAEANLIVNGYEASRELINAKFPNAGLAGYDDAELNEVIESLNGVDGMGEALMDQSNDLQGLDFYDHTQDAYAYQ